MTALEHDVLLTSAIEKWANGSRRGTMPVPEFWVCRATPSVDWVAFLQGIPYSLVGVRAAIKDVQAIHGITFIN